MAKFVEVTEDGKPVLVNFDFVVAVRSTTDDEGGTITTLTFEGEPDIETTTDLAFIKDNIRS